MKRFHVHARVADLQRSIAFYSKLFGAAPTRVESDYARWMLDDPRLNFAISARGGPPGIDHLGLQAADGDEFAGMRAGAAAAGLTLHDSGETDCCYARSDKHWLVDPQGIAWEHFHTLGDIEAFGASGGRAAGCCGPGAPQGEPHRAAACCGAAP